MRPGTLVVLLLAVAAAAGIWLYGRPPPPEAPSGPPARPAAGASPEPASPSPAPIAGTAAAAPRLLAAALTRAFHGSHLPRPLLERLAAGDVAFVARELAASPDPVAAARLYDLAALCATEGRPDEPAVAAEREALATAAASETARTLLAVEIAARHAFGERLRAGCRAAALDDAAIAARLKASGEAGDAASLERLAATDPQPLGRLTSAALLGSPEAQFRLALEYLPKDPTLARSWLEAAARGDADALGYQGACELNGCFGEPDPVAARQTLEAAARGGSRYALGLLATSGSDAAGRWPLAGIPVAPLPPRDPDALGLDARTRYAWSELARALAADGCFGFDFPTTATALVEGAALERAQNTAELAAGRAAAAALSQDAGAALRTALGCAGDDAPAPGSR